MSSRVEMGHDVVSAAKCSSTTQEQPSQRNVPRSCDKGRLTRSASLQHAAAISTSAFAGHKGRGLTQAWVASLCISYYGSLCQGWQRYIRSVYFYMCSHFSGGLSLKKEAASANSYASLKSIPNCLRLQSELECPKSLGFSQKLSCPL